jgi:hypothetical protein
MCVRKKSTNRKAIIMKIMYDNQAPAWRNGGCDDIFIFYDGNGFSLGKHGFALGKAPFSICLDV